MAETLVLLHGFAGTRRSWDRVVDHLDRERYTPLALDLPGHGEAGGVRPVTPAGCVRAVLAAAPDAFALCGYSMGGRIALHVALAAPDRVIRLVLAATTAGIEDAAGREARARADAGLAERVEQGTIEAFAAEWMAQPLFDGTPAAVGREWAADLSRNTPAGVAAALRGLSPGVMEPVWHRLGELDMPATVLAGERDAKYAAIGRRLAAALPRGRLVIVPGAGHGLPREAPAAVAAAISPPPERTKPRSSPV